MYKTKWITAPYLPQKSKKLSATAVDGIKMAEEITTVCNTMEREGFKLVNSPISMIGGIGTGQYAALKNKGFGIDEHYAGGWGYGYGFSFTSGVMLLFHNDKV